MNKNIVKPIFVAVFLFSLAFPTFSYAQVVTQETTQPIDLSNRVLVQQLIQLIILQIKSLQAQLDQMNADAHRQVGANQTVVNTANNVTAVNNVNTGSASDDSVAADTKPATVNVYMLAGESGPISDRTNYQRNRAATAIIKIDVYGSPVKISTIPFNFSLIGTGLYRNIYLSCGTNYSSMESKNNSVLFNSVESDFKNAIAVGSDQCTLQMDISGVLPKKQITVTTTIDPSNLKFTDLSGNPATVNFIGNTSVDTTFNNPNAN